MYKEFSINDVLDAAKHTSTTKHLFVVDGITCSARTPTFKLIRKYGIQCTCCKAIATHFILLPNINSYTHSPRLMFSNGTYMTKDHIIPKSKGGPNKQTNFQLMCYDCNLLKADNII